MPCAAAAAAAAFRFFGALGIDRASESRMVASVCENYSARRPAAALAFVRFR